MKGGRDLKDSQSYPRKLLDPKDMFFPFVSVSFVPISNQYLFVDVSHTGALHPVANKAGYCYVKASHQVLEKPQVESTTVLATSCKRHF